ncbi:NAD-dependent epimerase/dehydratase family protein [Pseudoxanthomonas sp. CCNWLW251]|jgi:uncharacterized protein YbjT (DUF2867 family)
MAGMAQRSPEGNGRTVLVVGGAGFIGGYLVAALHRHGWRVLRAVRPKEHALADDERACDLMAMQRPENWRPLLDGVDAVVNAAGILREEGGQTFGAVHVAAPLALAHACVDRGVKRFVQVSALGLPEDGPFIASKHRFDEQLAALAVSSVVLRPSVVYSVSGSYGGTSLLRALAGFPGAQWLPGDGRWQVQPVAAEDVGELVARAVDGTVSGTYEVGGPAPMSLHDYQRQWRRWLRVPGERVVAVPEACVSLAVSVMEAVGRGPVGRTMWRMLRRGNTTAPEAADRLEASFGLRPRTLAEALAQAPSQVQDRWQAQLYFLAPALRWAVVALWLLSALAGLVTPAADILRLSSGTPLAAWEPIMLARVGGVADLLLGLWLASGWRPRAAIGAMLLLLVAYTLLLGGMVPALWWDPLGGMAKNLVLLPALAVLWVLTERR